MSKKKTKTPASQAIAVQVGDGRLQRSPSTPATRLRGASIVTRQRQPMTPPRRIFSSPITSMKNSWQQFYRAATIGFNHVEIVAVLRPQVVFTRDLHAR